MAIDFRPFDFAGSAVAAIMPYAALVAGAIAGMMEDENGKKKRIKKKTKEVKEIGKGELKGV
jgi:hypothetical protein